MVIRKRSRARRSELLRVVKRMGMMIVSINNNFLVKFWTTNNLPNFCLIEGHVAYVTWPKVIILLQNLSVNFANWNCFLPSRQKTTLILSSKAILVYGLLLAISCCHTRCRNQLSLLLVFYCSSCKSWDSRIRTWSSKSNRWICDLAGEE